MIRRFILAAMAAAWWAPPAVAQGGLTGSAGAYLVHERAEVETPGIDASDSDLGFGLKGRLEFTENVFGAVEFQDAKLSSFRLGGGVELPANVDTDWILAGALVDKDVDDGLGLFAGAQHRASRQLELRGVLGLLVLDDFNGVEAELGASYQFDRYLSLFGELRLFQGNGRGRADFRSSEFHIGAAYNFSL